MNETAIFTGGSVSDIPVAREKFLTFTLNRIHYGIPVIKVREIIELMPITSATDLPPHSRGVINLRGERIPVIDLRLMLGFEERVPDERTCIVVVQVEDPKGARQVGIVVDSVSEIMAIQGDEIEENSYWRTRLEDRFVLGLARSRGRMEVLLDVDNILGGMSWAA